MLLMAIAVTNVACAEDTKSDNDVKIDQKEEIVQQGDDIEVTESDCTVGESILTEFPGLEALKVSDAVIGRDANSLEKTVTHTVVYTNGDTAIVEQKFCYMYNFEVKYKLGEVTKSSFEDALKNIGHLIESVKQDYKFKAPFASVVDMTMNQNGLDLSKPFKIGLPTRAVKSSDSVEHHLSFEPAKKNKGGAKIVFYFGLGGM